MSGFCAQDLTLYQTAVRTKSPQPVLHNLDQQEKTIGVYNVHALSCTTHGARGGVENVGSPLIYSADSSVCTLPSDSASAGFAPSPESSDHQVLSHSEVAGSVVDLASVGGLSESELQT